ncbi:YdcH family protein [Comamonas sp. GB3 AK4-5]|uniref:YdcH family protein n=1 Tax=Comamonas sp. GB3 AK4-5 TaxID=3231487 RepID=UPI00351EA6C9
MFPEYRERIAELRANDRHFSRLFDQHNALDHEIKNLEDRRTPSLHSEIEKLKKEKLLIKEKLYAFLKNGAGGTASA